MSVAEESSESTETDVRETSSGNSRLADLLGAVALVTFGVLILLNSGDGVDWTFPKGLAYMLLGLGVLLAGRGLGRRGPWRTGHSADRKDARDAFLFILLATAYVLSVTTLGFWIATALMVIVAGILLSSGRPTRREVVTSVIVAVVLSVVGNIVFQGIFAIDLPWGVFIG